MSLHFRSLNAEHMLPTSLVALIHRLCSGTLSSTTVTTTRSHCSMKLLVCEKLKLLFLWNYALEANPYWLLQQLHHHLAIQNNGNR